MAKQPTKEAPTDPLAITVEDDPHYQEEDLSWDNPSEEEIEEESDDSEDEDDSETPDEDTSDDNDSDDDSDDDPDDEEDDEDPIPDPEKYVTMERYKELQSAWTKGTQKVIRQVKVREKAIDLLPELHEDHSKLLEVYEEEQDVAEYLLEKFYEWKTIQEFAKEWLGKDYTPKSNEKPDDIDPEKIREEERQKVLKEIADKENSDYLGKLITEAKVNEEQAKAIIEEFDDIVNGRAIDKAKVKKYFQTAYYSVIGKRPTSKTAKVAKSTAHRKGGWWSKKKTDSTPKHVKESVEFLKEMWY